MFVGIDSPAPHQDMFYHWLISNQTHNLDTHFLSLRVDRLKQRCAKARDYCWQCARLAYIIKTVCPDVVFVSSFANAALASVVPVPRASKLVYQSQDWLDPYCHRLRSRLEGRLCRRANVVIWNEANRAAEAQRIHGLADMPLILPTYLPAAYPIPAFSDVRRTHLRALSGSYDAECRFVFAGGTPSQARMSSNVIAAVARQTTKYAVVFTGKENTVDEAITRQLKTTGVPHVFLGDLLFDEMLEYAAACDIGILLYSQESFGNQFQQPGRLTEFLRCGLSCLATPFPDAKRIARETGYIEVVQDTDPLTLGTALNNLANRNIRREHIQLYARTELTYDSAAEQVLDSLLKII